MSKKWGILYHHGGRLRKDKGWSEKESDNPPDKFWEGEIDNKLPIGFGTYNTYQRNNICWILQRWSKRRSGNLDFIR